MLVVRAALAEEQVMRRAQEEIREVEERVEALLLPLESCFNLQQGEMRHVKVLALHCVPGLRMLVTASQPF